MREIRISQMYPVACFWGNGHTEKSDPILQGWRCRPVNNRVWVVGQTRRGGCATIIDNAQEHLHICVFWESPDTVASAVKDGSIGQLDFRAYEIDRVPGAGLAAIEKIEAEREYIGDMDLEVS